MRYVNTETGTVIDVPCPIAGGSWTPETPPKQGGKKTVKK